MSLNLSSAVPLSSEESTSMYDVNIDLHPSSDWIECSSARAWARSDLPVETVPSFGSSARSTLRQSIADDEADMMRLEDSIRGMILKLQELQHRVGQNRVRLAPIHLIPNETLSAIFLEWSYSRDPPKYSMQGRFLPPSTIMKVCRRWTACAMSTPALWTLGKHRIGTLDPACFDHARIVRSYFDRSGSRNLKVHFGGYDKLDQAHNIWREVMEPSLFRMEDLTLLAVGTGPDDLDSISDWPERRFVMSLTVCTPLSQLCLHGIDFLESDSQTPIELPTVRTIEYIICNGNPPIHCPGLETCQIEECRLSYSYPRSLSDVSQSLETARLCMTYQDSERGSTQPMFPCLKHLEIEYHDDLSIPKCFYEGSNICSLYLYLSNYIFSRVIDAISLSSSSASALTYLTLNMTSGMVALNDTNIHIMQEWMVQAQHLVEFQLILEWDNGSNKKYGMNMYIDPLLTTKRNPPSFPRLKHITIRGELRLEAALQQLLVDRATDAERVEAGFPACGVLPGIVQQPCLLTILESETFPEMKSVGLKEFMGICRTQAMLEEEEGEDSDTKDIRV